MNRTVVLNVVGLTRSLLGPHTPRLSSFAAGAVADVEAVTPALTCSAQATYLTGTLPREHGVVANGWYFRDTGEIALWKQSNKLMQGEKLWQKGRRQDPAFTCANSFWWFNMHTDVDWSVTPRPLYCADGRKLPDCYSDPPGLRDRFNRDFGQFPLFKFWGPATSIECSEWIGKAALAIEQDFSPTLHLVYLPHLDYVLQKVGPQGDLSRDLRQIDELCGRLIDVFRDRGCRVVLLSEYGISAVRRPIHPNRVLREAGYLAIKEDLGRDTLDPGRCRAFAVSDHQIAHVYVEDPADVPAVKALFATVPGVEHVLDAQGKRAFGLDHSRAGELVLLSSADSWFTYYFWNDDSRAPDYARTVNIHAKPGYDPCELFLDPRLPAPRLSIAGSLLKKMLGFRYLMEVIPLDASLVKGSHGRVSDQPAEGPLLMTSEPRLLRRAALRATDVRDLLLDHVFVD